MSSQVPSRKRTSGSSLEICEIFDCRSLTSAHAQPQTHMGMDMDMDVDIDMDVDTDMDMHVRICRSDGFGTCHVYTSSGRPEIEAGYMRHGP